MASAIYRAFKEYKNEFEKENNVVTHNTSSTNNPVPVVHIDTPNNGVTFKVQFYSSPRKIDISDTRFSKLSDVSLYQHNGLYKYTTGNFNTLDDAVLHQKKTRANGYSDAFIVAFDMNTRITLDKAKKLTQ